MNEVCKRGVIALILLCVCFSARSASAEGGANAAQQAGVAIQKISACEVANQGQALIDCVGNTMTALSQAINRGEVARQAPRLVALAAEAGGITGKPKAEARRILNGVIAICNGLRTDKDARDVLPGVNAVGRAFGAALRAIDRRG